MAKANKTKNGLFAAMNAYLVTYKPTTRSVCAIFLLKIERDPLPSALAPRHRRKEKNRTVKKEIAKLEPLLFAWATPAQVENPNKCPIMKMHF